MERSSKEAMSAEQPSVWPVSDIIVFDCDSTLSTIEGIDELACLVDDKDDVSANIAALTKRAMEGDIPLEAVYGQRLVAVNPTQSQVRRIAQIYRETAIHDAKAVIEALQVLGAKVFVVSGGLKEPVRDFSVWLGVPAEHIFAVDMEYDQLSGKWWRYWDQLGGQNTGANYLSVEANPLTGTHGKNRIIAGIRAAHAGRALLIGDGLSDLEAGEEVDLFIGFGGAVYRQRIAEQSSVYIRSASLSPVLPLAMGQMGNIPRYSRLWTDGLQRIYSGEVIFQSEALKRQFTQAMRRGR
jgi:phosphoserine phosphatase